MTRIRSRQLGVILLLLGPALGKAGIENVSERLFETTSGQLGSQNALRATFATPEGGVVRFGSTRNGGRDAQGEFCAEAFCYFVQLIRRDGTAVFRYLPFPVVLSQGALDSAGFAWIEVFLPVGARATFDPTLVGGAGGNLN